MKPAREMEDLGKVQLARGIGRRRFLRLALASGGLAASYLRSRADALAAHSAFPFNQVASANGPSARGLSDEMLTRNVDFFVRNHFRTPTISEQAWRLEISGLISRPLNLSYSDLLLANSAAHPATLECAGNRSGGAGVGTAVWSGLSLAELLGQAGLQRGATTVVFYGADSGEVEGLPPGTHYARAIPLEKAMNPATLLAYEMNGQPLPADHGFPLRALVPGWYGMDSVKWLTRIEILDRPFNGYFQQQEYVATKTNGERTAITTMRVNSKILRPTEGEEIRQKNYRVEGVAWAGERKVAKVELATGTNGNWQTASLSVPSGSMVWTPWTYDWQIPAAGEYTLKVRASDDEGHDQPELRDAGRQDPYELNTCQRVKVSVRL
jgi:DMSO/TMAO reductase YedYZ molybdopterin-dependent catalytic subunit